MKTSVETSLYKVENNGSHPRPKGFSHPELHRRPARKDKHSQGLISITWSLFRSAHFAGGRKCTFFFFFLERPDLRNFKNTTGKSLYNKLLVQSVTKRQGRERKEMVFKYLPSLGSSPLSFSHVMVGIKVWSWFTLHSKDTVPPRCTTAYSGCLMILVASEI